MRKQLARLRPLRPLPQLLPQQHPLRLQLLPQLRLQQLPLQPPKQQHLQLPKQQHLQLRQLQQHPLTAPQHPVRHRP